jgi:hypothetical protein
MQRRTLVKYLAIGGPVAAIGGGYLWLSADRDHPQLSLSATLQKLERLASGPITKSGSWNPYQVFNHCAQSVEFSMTGFPESESALFQHTAGAVAFAVFCARGEMSHNLAEVIPGAPALAVEGDNQVALQRLMTALTTFDAYDGPLKPHFAFGNLGKSDYALAHVLHINNHLQEFSVA